MLIHLMIIKILEKKRHSRVRGHTRILVFVSDECHFFDGGRAAGGTPGRLAFQKGAN